MGERHPGLPLPRRAGSRLLAAGRRRRPHRPARPAHHRPDRRAGRHLAVASWRWCTTSASRAGSSTCCAWPSRPRRCRSARGSSPPTARSPGRRRRRAGRPRRGAAGAVAPAGPAARGVAAARPGWAPASSARRWRRTPRCCSPTRPRRRGTRPTASCRSSSSARRPPPPGGLGMIGSPRARGGPGAPARRRRCAARAGGGAPDGAEHGPHRRAAAPGPRRHADEGEQGAHRGRCRRGRPPRAAAAASPRCCPGPRSWPGRRAPGSRCSRPGRPRRATPATRSSPSGSGSSADRPSRLRRRRRDQARRLTPARPLCAEVGVRGRPATLCRGSAFGRPPSPRSCSRGGPTLCCSAFGSRCADSPTERHKVAADGRRRGAAGRSGKWRRAGG